ncbi:MAG: HAD hydrolase family protein [Flavobacteriales bacterium]|jgi:3-deoxy-D-manno-octulosonate 8-phosphate phosphatase (KDO 8-P phosphatase)|nr:HAD hydrolase family protein [Flavobacteriales bacterium]
MTTTTTFQNIALFAFDYDGVFTDGTVLLMPDGSQPRQAFVRDGYAVQWAVKQGLPLAVITGAKENSIATRMAGLGVTETHLGSQDKMAIMQNICDKMNIGLDQVAYMGDDMPDLPLLRAVGLAACPSDAVPEILETCHFISSHPGGSGCVRELLETCMKERGIWMAPGHEKW